MKIYMLIGCPGIGKTWIVKQVEHDFVVVPHDARIHSRTYERGYVDDILQAIARKPTKPLLIEVPFSISKILGPLRWRGFDVEPLFIQEQFNVIADRYFKREGRLIPLGHLKRQETYLARAVAEKAKYGSAEAILRYLKEVAKCQSSEPTAAGAAAISWMSP